MEQPLLAQSRGPQNKPVPAHHGAQSRNATFPAPPAAGSKAVCRGRPGQRVRAAVLHLLSLLPHNNTPSAPRACWG